MFSRVTDSVDQRLGRWLEQRIPPASQKTLSHREIFVLPTRWGLVYGAMIVLILITGINFQNSMILAVGLFLVALFLLTVVITYQNLAGLSLTYHGGKPCHAGQLAGFEFVLLAGDSSHSALQLGWVPDQFVSIDVNARSQLNVTIECATRQRGIFKPGRMLLTTTYPFGLVRSWSWQDMQAETLVYPQIIVADDLHLQSEGGAEHAGAQSAAFGQEDFAGLKNYIPGESLNRVAWKKYAQTGEFFSKEFSRPSADPEWVDFRAFQVADIELRLAYMCGMVSELNESGAAFGLRMPGLTISPQHSQSHYQQCLTALALYPNHVTASV